MGINLSIDKTKKQCRTTTYRPIPRTPIERRRLSGVTSTSNASLTPRVARLLRLSVFNSASPLVCSHTHVWRIREDSQCCHSARLRFQAILKLEEHSSYFISWVVVMLPTNLATQDSTDTCGSTKVAL